MVCNEGCFAGIRATHSDADIVTAAPLTRRTPRVRATGEADALEAKLRPLKCQPGVSRQQLSISLEKSYPSSRKRKLFLADNGRTARAFLIQMSG